MKRIIAVMGVLMLATVSALGCASTSGNSTPATSGSSSNSCAYPTLREADGQSLEVSPGDSVILIAQDVVSSPCPDRSPGATAVPSLSSVEFGVLWSQSGTSTAVAEISSNGDPVAFEFEVPADAMPGAAIVTVEDASIELVVTN